MGADAEILFECRGKAGIVTLNRPKALNALTHEMVVAMKEKLDDWARDDGVSIVIVRGEGERAFCSGGDIRAVAQSGRAGTRYALDFWRDEYLLDAAIKRYPKPYLALIQGIVMGGGVGISVHGSYRVADETTLFAMPETGIGFFPDVGGSFFLPRCPGEIGLYLALTGARLKTADTLYAGIATHFVERQFWPCLMDAMTEGEAPADVLAELSGYCRMQEASTGELMQMASPGFLTLVEDRPPHAPLEAQRQTIDRIFAADSVEEILARLDADESSFARETAATIRAKSPTSLKLAFCQMRAGRDLCLEDCLKMEYRMASRILAGHDFAEGVRAALIDKDQSPRWQPAKLGEVSEHDIDAYFEPLGENELRL